MKKIHFVFVFICCLSSKLSTYCSVTFFGALIEKTLCPPKVNLFLHFQEKFEKITVKIGILGARPKFQVSSIDNFSLGVKEWNQKFNFIGEFWSTRALVPLKIDSFAS